MPKFELECSVAGGGKNKEMLSGAGADRVRWKAPEADQKPLDFVNYM
jgi:hypothetical protein